MIQDSGTCLIVLSIGAQTERSPSTTAKFVKNRHKQARDQHGSPEGAESFLRGTQIFELCPIILDDVQYIFRRGASPPLRPSGYGPGHNHDSCSKIFRPK